MTPTAFVFTPPPADGSKPSGFVFLAFDPGETFVEVASHDPTADSVNFYLVLFDKDCTTNGGCKNRDLLTQKLTEGWSNLREYESSTALNNTIADCRQCHAPDDSKPQILRMQEIKPPFTHWFSMQTTGGQALYEDFHKAHAVGEDYGPIPAALVDKSDPALMAQMITQAGFGDQPNAFDSAAIEAEVAAAAPMQPWSNAASGASATWQAAYDNAVAGQFIATPYHDVKVTDPTKLAKMTNAYHQFMSGGAADLPDIRDVFLDVGLRDMGFAPKVGLTGRQLLSQMCQQCHHSKLDLTISREKFLVDQLDTMNRDGEGRRDSATADGGRHPAGDAAGAVPHHHRRRAAAHDRRAQEVARLTALAVSGASPTGRVASAIARQRPRCSRCHSTSAPMMHSPHKPSQPPNAPSPARQPSSHASGGVITHAVTTPTTAAKRTSPTPRKIERAAMLAPSNVWNTAAT